MTFQTAEGNTNNNATQKGETMSETKHTPFKLEFSKHANFSKELAVNHVGYMSSNDFLLIAKELFGSYADFVGSSLKITDGNGGRCFIMLRFDHLDHTNDPRPTAFSIKKADVGNNGMTQTQKNMAEINAMFNAVAAQDGKTFHITQEGMEGLAPFMEYQTRDQNGNIQWDALYNDSIDNGVMYTDLIMVRPESILEAWCTRHVDPDDPRSSTAKYMVTPSGGVGQYGNQVYKLTITQFDEKNVAEQATMFGYCGNNGFVM